MTQTIPLTQHSVLDGGSILHRLKWKDGSTYSSIADNYASFTFKRYGRATVVFDGHEAGPSIKDCTPQRRNQKLHANKVNITEVSKFTGEKGGLLVKSIKQAGADPTEHGTNEAERLQRYSRRRC